MAAEPSAEFLLAYARRNVPVDFVLTEADQRGLQYEVLSTGYNGVEPIYSFTWKQT
jgi:hypothetical protein